jgi:hypothetical protein
MSKKLRNTHAIIANTLGDLSTMFHKDCKLTFIMRDPYDDEAFIVVSDDDNDAVIEVLRNASPKDELKLTDADLVAAKLGFSA